MEIPPPENNNKNYSPIQNSTDQTTTQKENTNQETLTQETTIIPETQIILETEPEEIPLSSPSLVTNNKYHLLQSTPDPENINIPEPTPKMIENNNENSTPESPIAPTENNNENTKTIKRKPLIPLDQRQYKAKKMATELQIINFCDTGFLSNAIDKIKKH